MNIAKLKTLYFVKIFPFREISIGSQLKLKDISDNAFFIDGEIININLDRQTNSLVHSASMSIVTQYDYEFGDNPASFGLNSVFNQVKGGDWFVVYKSVTGGQPDPDKIHSQVIETIEVPVEGVFKQVKAFKRFFGKIERVNTKATKGDNSSDIQILNLTGLSFGKTIADSILFVNSLNVDSTNFAYLSNFVEMKINTTVKEAVISFLRIFMGKGQMAAHKDLDFPVQKIFSDITSSEKKEKENFLLYAPKDVKDFISAGGKFFYQLLNLDIEDTGGKTSLDLHRIRGGTLEQLIDQYADRLRNEVFADMQPYDLGGGKSQLVPTLKIREYPFTSDLYSGKMPSNRNKFSDLEPSFYIDYRDGYIFDMDVGKSAHEHFNFFVITPDFTVYEDLYKNYEALNVNKNEEYLSHVISKIAIHGLKIRQGSTMFIDYDKKHSVDYRDIIQEYSQFQRDWYIDIDNKYSGVIVGVFPFYLELGSKLVITNYPRKKNGQWKLYNFECYLVGIQDSRTINKDGSITTNEILRVTFGSFIPTNNSLVLNAGESALSIPNNNLINKIKSFRTFVS